MRRKIILLVILAVAALGALALHRREPAPWQGKKNLVFKENRVAVLPIYGPIDSSLEVVRWLRRFDREVKGVKAVVLDVDSPGGSVAPSQEIYEAVRKIKAHGKTVVVYMSSEAASGAYYLSCPADRIFASPGTLTGSIGVYMEKPSAGRLLEKVGLKFEVVKSGRFKDTGTIARDLDPAERDYLQELIDDTCDQFVSVVAEEREGAFVEAMKKQGLPPAGKGAALKRAVRRYAESISDGRAFTGREAVELGLVDELGDLDDAIDSAARLAGIEGEPDVVSPRYKTTWAEYFTGMSESDLKIFFRNLVPSSGGKICYRAW